MKCSRLIPVFITLMLIFAQLTAAYAAGFSVSEAGVEQESSEILTFSNTADHPITLDRLIQYALSQVGYSLRVKTLGMAAAIRAADSGETDGLACQVDGVENEYQNLVRVKRSIGDVQFNAYVLDDNKSSIDSWDQLAGMRVGLLYEKIYIEKSLPEDVESVHFKLSHSDLLDGLLAEEYDVAVFSQIGGNEPYITNGVRLAGVTDKQPIYMYLNKRHAALAAELEQALERMDSLGVGERILEQGWLQRNTYKKTFLFINSYDALDPWGNAILSGVRDELSRTETNEIIFINTSSYREAGTSTSSRDEIVTGILRADLLKRAPDAIIASDVRALEFITKNYHLLYKGIPVIYGRTIDQTGMSVYTFQNEGYDGHFTAIEENMSISETVDGIIELFPKTQSIFVINDYTTAGVALRERIDQQLEAYKGVLDITYSPDVMFFDLLEIIRSLPEDTVILCGNYNVDNVGAEYGDKEVQMYFANSAKVPMFGLLFSTFGYGQLGGMYMDSETFGRALAAKAVKLNGGNTSMEANTGGVGSYSNKWIFDNVVMQEHGISRSSLPQDAVIINEQKYFYSDFTALMWTIFIGAILLPATALALLFEIRRQQMLGKRHDSMRAEMYTEEDLLSRMNAIEEAKNRFAKIISGAPVGFAVSSNGVVLDVNRYFQEEMGLSVGKSILSIYNDEQERNSAIYEMDKTGRVSFEVANLKNARGRVRRYFINGTKGMYYDTVAYIAWFMDIEDTESQKDLIRQTHEDLQKVLSALPIPLVMLNPSDLKITYGNNAFVGLFSYDYLGSLMMRSLYEFFPGGQADGQNSYLSARSRIQRILDSGEGSTFEWQYLLENGEILHTKTMATAITYHGERMLVGVLQDIGSEREQAKALYEIAEREKQANQAKSRFLVSMSHEIRTPMNGITGLSEIAMRKQTDRENYEVFKKINISAKNLLAIINDILDFSKIEAEELDIIETEFDIEEVIGNALLMATQRAGSKEIEILMKMEADIPTRVIADKTRLWQVLKNLLDNSAKYTEKGKIRLVVENITGDLNLESGAQLIRFTVEDTGMGMTELQLSRIFMPYEQFHNRRTNRISGTGLGMTITKQLTELMGGKIEVESKAGEGTAVKVAIPLKTPGGALRLGDTFNKFNFEGMRVLAVDDDEFSLEVLSSLLEEIGVNPVCVNNGKAGIDIAEQAQREGKPFHVIILDYMMPGLTGIEVAKGIKQSGEINSKLLMVSAYTRQLVMSEIQDAGFDGVLEKPFCPSEFVQKLGAAMEARANEEPEVKIIFNGARVLLCEDNLINQNVATGMLSEFGIEPVIAGDGQACMDILDADDAEGFHLILMDILMPVMDGHMATKLIRSSIKPYKDVPIVAMTANVMQDEIERCKREGMNGHIGKPVSFDVLCAELVKWIPEEYRQK